MSESAYESFRAPSAATLIQQAGAALGQATATAVVGGRDAIRRNRVSNTAYCASIGIVGGTTMAVGVALIPLPGPGALVSLGGLGILATEFEWARRVQTRGVAAARRALAASTAAARRAAARRAAARSRSRRAAGAS